MIFSVWCVFYVVTIKEMRFLCACSFLIVWHFKNPRWSLLEIKLYRIASIMCLWTFLAANSVLL